MSKMEICVMTFFVILALSACRVEETPEDNGLTSHQTSSEALTKMDIGLQKTLVEQTTDFSDNLMALIRATDIRKVSTYCSNGPIKRDGGAFFRCQINIFEYQGSEGLSTRVTLAVSTYSGVDNAFEEASPLIRESREVFSVPGAIQLDDVLR